MSLAVLLGTWALVVHLGIWNELLVPSPGTVWEAALDEAGLSADDVDLIDAEPDDIYAAWTRGDIDATYVWNPNLAEILDEGGNVLVTSAELAEQGTTTYDLAVVSNDFAADHPEAVQTWVEQQDRAVRLIADDPDAAAEAIAVELNITPTEAAEQLTGLLFPTAADQAGDEYLAGGVPTNVFATAEFNQSLGEIDSVEEEQFYVDAIDPSHAAAVTGG